MDKIKIICVVGATASGKTGLGVELAKKIGGEIISADSMQVYRGMSIATAAATNDEQQGIPHYLLEFLNPSDTFSVADFVKLAGEKVFDINNNGKVPIIVGGTGLFIDSLVQNITFADVQADDELRKQLNQKSTDELYNELMSVDSAAAESIHKNNRKRVIRALELYYGGVSKTEQNEKSRIGENPFDALYIGINYRNREVLYDRINRRVDLMLDAGLINEAKSFADNEGITSRQAIGHKELKPYFDGVITLDEAVDNIKKGTRHYAKRQLTWFRRNNEINWLYADEMKHEELINKAVSMSLEFLKK
ncbi:MAG: tRNA (adenosine(37)-N6)-dimethylallyltransferase MiaA [Eubacterium sp.]